MVSFISAILGFLGGLLSFGGGLRIYQSGLLRCFSIWNVSRQFEKAYLGGNREEITRLELALQTLKLYSSSVIYQAAAISYFAEWKCEASFEILADRLGNSPELSPPWKTLLLSELKRLARNLNSIN